MKKLIMFFIIVSILLLIQSTSFADASYFRWNVIEGDETDNDDLVGTSSNDKILGYGQNDILKGMGARDWLLGGEGHDHLYGGSGNDHLYGENGNDFLRGDAGNDSLHGGHGKDTLVSTRGRNTLWGGIGNDTFEFRYCFLDNNIALVKRDTSGVNKVKIYLRYQAYKRIDLGGGKVRYIMGNYGVNYSNSITIENINDVAYVMLYERPEPGGT